MERCRPGENNLLERGILEKAQAVDPTFRIQGSRLSILILILILFGCLDINNDRDMSINIVGVKVLSVPYLIPEGREYIRISLEFFKSVLEMYSSMRDGKQEHWVYLFFFVAAGTALSVLVVIISSQEDRVPRFSAIFESQACDPELLSVKHRGSNGLRHI